MTRHVALLRGINVGGHRRVPMAQLRECFTAAGATDVITYIQSGNVVFSAAPRTVARVVASVRGTLEDAHGSAIPIVTRTAAAWRAIVAGVPFADLDDDRASLHVGLFAELPAAAAVAALDRARSPGDRFSIVDDTLYLDLPRGVRTTRLTVAWFERELGTSCTVRNWRTMRALHDRLGGNE